MCCFDLNSICVIGEISKCSTLSFIQIPATTTTAAAAIGCYVLCHRIAEPNLHVSEQFLIHRSREKRQY